jgi:membrane protein
VSDVGDLARTAREKVRTDQLGVHAGSLTYGAFLAIPPLLILALTAISVVMANDAEAQQRLIDDVTALIPGLDQVLTSQFTLASAEQLGIGLVGGIALLWAVSSFAVRTRTALGVVFGTGLPTLLTGRVSGTAIGLASLLGFGLFATVTGWALGPALPLWTRPLLLLAIAAAGVGLFLLIYWALTPPGSGRPTVRDHWPGAVGFMIAAIGLERVGGVYISQVIARTTALYGAIGAIFGLLAFLYIAMWTFLLGAEVSQLIRERRVA